MEDIMEKIHRKDLEREIQGVIIRRYFIFGCIQCVNREIHAHELRCNMVRTRLDAYEEILNYNKLIEEIQKKLEYDDIDRMMYDYLENLKVKIAYD